jgi:hypothetical protein
MKVQSEEINSFEALSPPSCRHDDDKSAIFDMSCSWDLADVMPWTTRCESSRRFKEVLHTGPHLV